MNYKKIIRSQELRITFYPWSGYVKFTPDEFDYQLGSYFTAYG